MKEKSPNQTTGVMSTPNAGGMDPRINRRRGSVGQTTILNGNSLTLADGYHDRTMRHNFLGDKQTKYYNTALEPIRNNN